MLLHFAIARITMAARGRVHEREAWRASGSGISAGGPLLAHDTSLERALRGAHGEVRKAIHAHNFDMHGQGSCHWGAPSQGRLSCPIGGNVRM